MKSNQAPAIETLTAEVQTILSPLSFDEYQKYYEKGIEKGESSESEDWHKLRVQVGENMNKEYAKLGRAFCINDLESIKASQLMIAKNTAMQLGFEHLIQSEL